MKEKALEPGPMRHASHRHIPVEGHVESGFSINKDMLVENLHEKSLIALRTVYDGIKSNCGIENVQITEELVNHRGSG
ncbi:hypothetical protein JTE90_003384 [Oedothorax gibbosus]|uniref:Uncharacterized protein n=1 Tax=Oedothorax gibbosus TaxID=931172 RepID=A0AAV6TY27_9ARAC|nr:hypothetical protein JTE90_003384 [Oedothorax gibbosus]